MAKFDNWKFAGGVIAGIITFSAGFIYALIMIGEKIASLVK